MQHTPGILNVGPLLDADNMSNVIQTEHLKSLTSYIMMQLQTGFRGVLLM